MNLRFDGERIRLIHVPPAHTEGDTITSVDGQAVSSASDIQQALVKHHPGDKISVNWVDQNGQSQTATVTLASGPAA